MQRVRLALIARLINIRVSIVTEHAQAASLTLNSVIARDSSIEQYQAIANREMIL